MKKLWAACVVLAGCAGAELDPLEGIERRTDDPPGTIARAQAQEAESLSLEGALAMAEGSHPELAAARARVEAAEGRALQAGLFPNPVVVGRMESAPFEGGTTGNAEFLAGVSLRLPVGGRLGAAREAETLERERLLREFEVRRLEVRSRVQAAFAAALYAHEVVKLRSRMSEAALRGAAVAKARREAGDALAEEVARAEIEEARARLELDRAGGLRDLALVALASAIGNPLLRIGSVEGKLEAALEVPSIESVLPDLEASPHAALAEAEVQVLRGRVEQAKLERIPDVSLDLFYRRLEHSEKDAFDVGVGFALPLFDRNQGRIRELEAEAQAARARARGIRGEAVRKAREAHIRLSEAVRHARLLKSEILPRAETVIQGAEVRYAGGDMSLADILPIRRERASAELAYLEALREVMEAWAALRPYLSAR